MARPIDPVRSSGTRASRSPRGARVRTRRHGRSRTRGRGRGVAGATRRAQGALSGFRRATILAILLTSLVLLFLEPAGDGEAQVMAPESIPDTVSIIQPVPVEQIRAQDERRDEPSPTAAAEEATQTLRDIGGSFVEFLPRLGIALVVFLLAGLLVRAMKPVLRWALASFERANAYTALIAIGIWLVALGTAFGVVAGDVRALLGSIGLIGLALSWALQAPIESFTGWLLNSFRGYYRVGDRVAVGEVFGDVYRIDLLTTTVWEYGGPDRPPHPVRAEQPTGRLITFPNSEVLTGTVVNYTKDFPYVWDELSVPVANESELRYAIGVLRDVADEVLGEQMQEPAHVYGTILERARLEVDVPDRPQVFVMLDESWTNLVIRYLVAARERRRWKSDLALRVLEVIQSEEHRDRILPAFPRRQMMFVDEGGRVAPPPNRLDGA
jgi:small-conductance mechanosensitive channel